jgi:biopolymer transport protein ExbB/TolQ
MKTQLTIWLILGIILALGPIWGLIGQIVGMILCFIDLSQPAPDVGSLAMNINLALYVTVIGFVVCPIGIAIAIISGLKLSKAVKHHGTPY